MTSFALSGRAVTGSKSGSELPVLSFFSRVLRRISQGTVTS